jgi:hypothetical protein
MWLPATFSEAASPGGKSARAIISNVAERATEAFATLPSSPLNTLSVLFAGYAYDDGDESGFLCETIQNVDAQGERLEEFQCLNRLDEASASSDVVDRMEQVPSLTAVALPTRRAMHTSAR